MKTIDITKIISCDLKSRARVHDLKLFIQNCGDNEVEIDFGNVKFATRSFMDEFFNVFIKNPSRNDFVTTLTNVPDDIRIMLDTVSRTQNKVKTIPATSNTTVFKTIDELIQFLSGGTQ